jgi:hypothetical protein
MRLTEKRQLPCQKIMNTLILRKNIILPQFSAHADFYYFVV